MSKKVWKSSAPSNIALIKYMGKTDGVLNLATNPSLSFTLEHLRTFVEISPSEANQDSWKALVGVEGLHEISLSAKGQGRYLTFFAKLKAEMGIHGNYEVKSASNFPSDCGLASSASSFAALTLATYELAKNKFGADYSLEALSLISREGSGSSCRSFFGPWCQWQDENVESLQFPFKNLIHHCVVVEDSVKQVSSSQAHINVLSSPLFKGRIERAGERLEQFKEAMNNEDWKSLFNLCWSEFWDMHALFETSQPPFGYMTSGSLIVLNFIRDYWIASGDGPLVTMDAGANVHLLFREDQKQLSEQLIRQMSFRVY